ncbi:MAG: indolepyruvate oxidoreductase subunit beta [Desulfobacterales bacterium]|nr:indolepyruvate oxidoreductase subunit beta [Desulfobacterales bacterium]
MDTVNIILCGLGGQGILFVTKVLAQAAMDKGFDVMGAETHGMAQRGGSVVSHLRIGPARGSLVRTGAAHYLLALEENEGYRNLPFLARGAGMYVNTGSESFPRQEVEPFLYKKQISCQGIAAGDMAMELGAPLSSNLALLGFFSAFGQGPITHAELERTIDSISPDRFKSQNLKVFNACYEEGVRRRPA